MSRFETYLEIGQKRTVAGALDWPGWCRIARDEAGALGALADYLPRYAAVLRDREFAETLAGGMPTFRVIERIAGDGSTDFGIPARVPDMGTILTSARMCAPPLSLPGRGAR